MSIAKDIGTAAENSAQQTAQKAADLKAPVTSLYRWFVDNLDGLVVGAVVAAAIVAFMLLVRMGGQRLHRRHPDCINLRGVIGNVLAKTTLLFMVASALAIVVNYAEVPARIAKLVDIFFVVSFALQGAIWARELIIGTIKARVGEDPGESTLGNAMSIMRVLVSVTVFAIAFIIILDNLGVNVTTLIAGFGIGGIAIGLAAQGIFSDLFAALAIVFDRPFRRGDAIRYGGDAGTAGTVERIGLKTTRIRSIGGEQVVIANTKLLEQEVTNIAEARIRRTWLPFGVIYQTPAEVLDRLPDLMTEAMKGLKTCKVVRAVATRFGDSSIDCELVYEDRSTDANVLAAHKSAIITGIMRVFEREGIEFAYPTQTSFTAGPDGRLIMPYPNVQPVKAVHDDEDPA